MFSKYNYSIQYMYVERDKQRAVEFQGYNHPITISSKLYMLRDIDISYGLNDKNPIFW